MELIIQPLRPDNNESTRFKSLETDTKEVVSLKSAFVLTTAVKVHIQSSQPMISAVCID